MGILHNAGQVAGHLLNLAPGYSTLGSNITNPYVNYKGAANPGAPQPIAQNTKSDIPKINEPTLQSSGGVSGSAAGDYDPDAVFQYDQGINQANQGLSHLDQSFNAGIGNLDSQYNQGYNTLLGQRAISDRNYDTGKTQQLQDYQTAREGVSNNTRNLLLNTRRLLGAQGAGGGSADRFAAPNAAQVEGNNQNAIVQKTNSRNLGALDTAYGDDKRNIDSGFANLAQQRAEGERSYRSQIEQSRAELLNTIATLTGQKAIANGQTLQQAQAAAAPYTNRIGGILSNIDALAASPATVRAQNIQLARPDLAQYQYDRFAAPTVAQQDPSLAPRNYQTLLGQDDKKQQLQLA